MIHSIQTTKAKHLPSGSWKHIGFVSHPGWNSEYPLCDPGEETYLLFLVCEMGTMLLWCCEDGIDTKKKSRKVFGVWKALITLGLPFWSGSGYLPTRNPVCGYRKYKNSAKPAVTTVPRRIILDSSHHPVPQSLTILFPSAIKDRSLTPPTAAKSCCQGHVHCAKCLEAGTLRNWALFLKSSCLGCCHTGCCPGAGGSCHSCFLSDTSSKQCCYQVPAMIAASSVPGAWFWEGSGRNKEVSPLPCVGLASSGAGVWHWGPFSVLEEEKVFVIKPEVFPWQSRG